MNDFIFTAIVLAALALAVLAVLMPLWVWLIYRSVTRIERIAKDAVYGKRPEVAPESKPIPFKQVISPPPSRPRL